MMTLPRTAAQVLSDHVLFEIRSVDRMLVTLYQPRLRYGSGIHGFFCHHRGYRFVSSTLMQPMSAFFAADIHHYIAVHGLDLVHFVRGQSKDDVAKQYLAGHDGTEGSCSWAGPRRGRRYGAPASAATPRPAGPTCGWPKESAMVNHFYFYGLDADFGPFFIKFCGYFPFTAQLYLNGHEYAKAQAAKAGIGFTPLDNAFAAVGDVARVQAICDDMTPDKIEAFARKWLRRLPTPFTPDDATPTTTTTSPSSRSSSTTTHVLDHPRSGRIFFDQLIRDNIDIGRPDKVSVVFRRQARRRGKHPTPGTFHTHVITDGVDPSVYVYYKSTQLKQYLKEGKALRTETTINQPHDYGIGKRLANLPDLAEVGYTANRRLLEVQRIGTTRRRRRRPGRSGHPGRHQHRHPCPWPTFHRPARPSPPVRLCTLAPLPHGFTNRVLRTHLAPLLGLTAEDMTPGQLT